jgi:hypothetical protein
MPDQAAGAGVVAKNEKQQDREPPTSARTAEEVQQRRRATLGREDDRTRGRASSDLRPPMLESWRTGLRDIIVVADTPASSRQTRR